MTENHTLSEIVGPWEEPDFKSGLIARCRDAWSKPIGALSRQELATLLRQKIAVDYLKPLAEKKIASGIDDDTEMFDGELAAAITYAKNA